MKNIQANLLDLASGCDSTVLITGPTGSGKTRLARRIHESSSRARGRFITVNLASLHDGVLESELFGHERGAFTGAEQRRVGKLEAAQGGTVFLDEIGELSPRLQARLLEFLHSRTISPVGSNREQVLNVRVIAATHQDLRKAVEEGRFREDLFHRLRVIALRLPALAESADHFDSILHENLSSTAKRLGRTIQGLSEEAAVVLESYDWPGNYRELLNVLEYAVLACVGVRIEAEHLPSWLREEIEARRTRMKMSGDLIPSERDEADYDYHFAMRAFEREFLLRAIRRFGGRVNRTAREIGLSKPTLIRRMQAFGIDREGLMQLRV